MHALRISVSGFGNEGRAPGVYASYMRTREPDVFEDQKLKEDEHRAD
jgi:hypothetical protein